MSCCYICNKRLLCNSLYLNCSVCWLDFQLLCLPGVVKSDLSYLNSSNHTWICVNCNVDIFPFNHHVDNLEFVKCFTEKKDKLSLDLENLLFDPLDLNQDCDYLMDLDPDKNYFSQDYVNVNNSLRTRLIQKFMMKLQNVSL